MRKYEIMYIVKADLDDASRQELVDRLHAIITSDGGVVTKVDEWGIKEYAYPINDETKGYYVVIKVEAKPETLDEFNRLARIETNVVRFLVVNEEE